MLKILTVVGARPQFIKAAAISRAIRQQHKQEISELILHTGQHYDLNMSEVFFKEMKIPQPNYNLEAGSSTHGEQTAKMISGIEDIILREKPSALIVYGDTNSTLAGALSAVKLHVPLVHIEAGLRSFKKEMPEEINRILTDHCSTLLFTPTKQGIVNLQNEGITLSAAPFHVNNPGVFHCGDVMYDNSIYFAELAEKSTDILRRHKLTENSFVLATIHREHNTNNLQRLGSIVEAMLDIAEDVQLLLPLHPRTKMAIEKLPAKLKTAVQQSKNIVITEPLSYLDMLLLEKNASLIITDSGGVQKESYFFKKPCLVLRAESEWVELIENGNNFLVDADRDRIVQTYHSAKAKNDFTFPDFYGRGDAADFICKTIVKELA